MESTYRITNNLKNSNAYFVSVSDKSVVMIDPGSTTITDYIYWLNNHNKTIDSILLTHEHYDHCAGVNALLDLFPIRLICSLHASKAIKNPKHNFSAYIEEVTPFEINHTPTIVKDFEQLVIGNKEFQFFETPGHSPGSMCIKVNNNIFTGDTLLNNIKTPINIPRSNKDDYYQSIKKLNGIIKPNSIIYPGHGEISNYRDIDLFI